MKKHLKSGIHIILLFLLSIDFAVAQQDQEKDLMWTVQLNSLQGNVNKTFSGGPNDLRHFHKLYEMTVKGLNREERIKIVFTFKGTQAVLIDTTTIAKGKHIFDNHAFIFSDCETYDYSAVYPAVGADIQKTPSSVVPNQGSSSSTVASSSNPTTGASLTGESQWKDPFLGTKNTISSDIDQKTPAVEGKGSFYMEGTSANSENKKFVCSLTRRILNNGTTVDVSLDSDEKNTWFFFYLYGAQDPTIIFQLTVSEGDSSMASGHYSSRDYYLHEIPLDFKGWKQFAIKYSDMQLELSGSNSDKIQNPSDIRSIEYRLLSNDPDRKVRVNLDYLAVLYNNKTKKHSK